MPLISATSPRRGARRASYLAALLAAGLAALAGAAPLAAQQTAAADTMPALPPLPEPPAPADTMTLSQAVTAALQYSPTMVQGQANLRDAQWGKRAAVGSFLPQLSVGSGASVASTDRYNAATGTFLSGSSDSYNASLSASMDLFTGGRRFAQIRQANAQSDAAGASLVEQRYNVTLSTKQAYLTVVSAEETMRVARASLEQAKEGLTAAQQRAQVGSATKADVLQAQLQVSQAQAALLSSQNARVNAERALGRLVGRDAPVAVSTTHLSDPTPLSMSDSGVVQLVMGQAPSVRAAQAQVKASEAGATAAKTQYLPSIRLSSGYDWVNQDLALASGRTSWSMRLSLSYPIFNGFTREQSVAQADNAANVARAQYSDARRAALVQVDNLLSTLHVDEQQVAIAKQSVSVAQQNLTMQVERYKVGASTILDRITSQVSLVQAEMSLVTARYNYQIARAQLDALVGREL